MKVEDIYLDRIPVNLLCQTIGKSREISQNKPIPIPIQNVRTTKNFVAMQVFIIIIAFTSPF